MYRTKLTKEQLAYNLSYHLLMSAGTDKAAYEVIIETLTSYEEKSKKISKTLDNE